MAIRVRLDRVLLDRQMTQTELAARIGITLPNLSVLKTGRARAIRLSTLDALCRELKCQPADLLEYVPAPTQPKIPPTADSAVPNRPRSRPLHR